MNPDLQHTPAYGYFATINGMQMYYEIHGQGTPLLLLHGYTNSPQQWRRFIDDFSQHYQLIIPDLRGHGRSLDPSQSFTLAQAAADTVQLLDVLGIGQLQAIGDSAGACMLLYMAAADPARITKMILLEGGSYFPPETQAALIEWSKTDDDHLGPERHLHIEGVRQMRQLLDRMPALIEDYAANPPDLAPIQTVTLLIFGDRDDLYPVSVPVAMYGALANAYLWIVPNTGHAFLVHHAEKYARTFTAEALAFLL